MKKAISMLLAASLMCGTAACGSAPQSTTGAAASQGTVSTPASDESASAKDWSTQDPYTVKLMVVGTAKTEDCEKIAKMASEITQPKYNTTIEIARQGFGAYDQELNLMFSSGEKLDLIYSGRGSFTTSVNNGRIVEIGQYLDEYAPEMKAKISEEDWSTVTLNNGIYAIPANKETAITYGFTMNKKMAEELGYDYSSIKKEEDLTPLLRLAKEKWPDVYPVCSSRGNQRLMTTMDTLGGDYGVLEDCTNQADTTVVNWYATDSYKKIVDLHWAWAQEGLMMPDGASNADPWNTLIGSGKAFGYFKNIKPGIEGELKNESTVDMQVIPLTTSYTTTANLDILWEVAYNSEKPERAVQILNEIYTNPELQNLLCNGIEGVHYEYKNDEKTMVGFPEGIDGSNTGYPSYPWAWPNEMITPVWEGAPLTLWADTDAFNKTATASPAKGFTWDNYNVLNEITACNNVRDKYANALENGAVNPDEALPQFIGELEEAGINKIIEEKQKQLDAWLAAK